MAIATMESRVTSLEALMAELISNVNRIAVEMREFKNEMREFKNEMREFKDEMREFKDEMREFKNEMREFKNEMLEFKNEMHEFKNEMSDFKDEMSEYKEWSRNQIKTMNRQWGDLANKMGTLAEDLVAPSVPRILRDYVGCPESGVEFMTVRFRGKKPTGEMQEFDVLAGCGNTLLINETKTTLQAQGCGWICRHARAGTRVHSGIRRQTDRRRPGFVLHRPNAHPLRRTPGADHARRNRRHHGSAQ